MQQQKQQSQFDLDPFTNLRQWRDAIIGLATFPALTLMVFMRQRVGFEKLSTGSLFGMAFMLYVLNAIGNFHISIPVAGTIGAQRETVSLAVFAGAFLIAGLWQRHLRWKDLLRGELWHTFTNGISYFEFLPIRLDLVYRVADPLIGLLAGLVMRHLGFGGLGLWVMWSALCLRLVEERLYEMRLREELDRHNGIVEARVQADSMTHWEGHGKEPPRARSLRETGGIPTGTDASLEAQIAKRKREAGAGGASEVQP
jgi:hypothetical protein